MQSFSDLGVSPEVVRALNKRGIDKPFAVQRLVFDDVIDGRDILVKSPTGSGKTLAFGNPVVERTTLAGGASALVLAPTRELASQIRSSSRLARPARCASAPSTAASASSAQAAGPASADPCRDTRAARGPACARRVQAGQDPDAGPR